jgi:hypothetical protein
MYTNTKNELVLQIIRKGTQKDLEYYVAKDILVDVHLLLSNCGDDVRTAQAKLANCRLPKMPRSGHDEIHLLPTLMAYIDGPVTFRSKDAKNVHRGMDALSVPEDVKILFRITPDRRNAMERMFVKYPVLEDAPVNMVFFVDPAHVKKQIDGP